MREYEYSPEPDRLGPGATPKRSPIGSEVLLNDFFRRCDRLPFEHRLSTISHLIRQLTRTGATELLTSIERKLLTMATEASSSEQNTERRETELKAQIAYAQTARAITLLKRREYSAGNNILEKVKTTCATIAFRPIWCEELKPNELHTFPGSTLLLEQLIKRVWAGEGADLRPKLGAWNEVHIFPQIARLLEQHGERVWASDMVRTHLQLGLETWEAQGFTNAQYRSRYDLKAFIDEKREGMPENQHDEIIERERERFREQDPKERAWWEHRHLSLTVGIHMSLVHLSKLGDTENLWSSLKTVREHEIIDEPGLYVPIYTRIVAAASESGNGDRAEDAYLRLISVLTTEPDCDEKLLSWSLQTLIDANCLEFAERLLSYAKRGYDTSSFSYSFHHQAAVLDRLAGRFKDFDGKRRQWKYEEYEPVEPAGKAAILLMNKGKVDTDTGMILFREAVARSWQGYLEATEEPETTLGADEFDIDVAYLFVKPGWDENAKPGSLFIKNPPLFRQCVIESGLHDAIRADLLSRHAITLLNEQNPDEARASFREAAKIFQLQANELFSGAIGYRCFSSFARAGLVLGQAKLIADTTKTALEGLASAQPSHRYNSPLEWRLSTIEDLIFLAAQTQDESLLHNCLSTLRKFHQTGNEASAGSRDSVRTTNQRNGSQILLQNTRISAILVATSFEEEQRAQKK